MLKGLAETEEDLRKKRIPFHLLQATEPRGKPATNHDRNDVQKVGASARVFPDRSCSNWSIWEGLPRRVRVFESSYR